MKSLPRLGKWHHVREMNLEFYEVVVSPDGVTGKRSRDAGPRDTIYVVVSTKVSGIPTAKHPSRRLWHVECAKADGTSFVPGSFTSAAKAREAANKHWRKGA